MDIPNIFVPRAPWRRPPIRMNGVNFQTQAETSAFVQWMRTKVTTDRMLKMILAAMASDDTHLDADFMMFDRDLVHWIQTGIQINPQFITEEPRVGKSCLILSVALLALYRGVDVAIGLAPNKVRCMQEFLQKLERGGFCGAFGVCTTSRCVDGKKEYPSQDRKDCRIFLFSHEVANDYDKMAKFVEERLDQNRKCMIILDEVQYISKKGSAQCAQKLDRYVTCNDGGAKVSFLVGASATHVPAVFRDSFVNLEKPVPRHLRPSRNDQSFAGVARMRLAKTLDAKRMRKYQKSDADAWLHDQLDELHTKWLHSDKEYLPYDGESFSCLDDMDRKCALNLTALYSLTPLVRSVGGSEDWVTHFFTGIALREKSSVVMVNIHGGNVGGRLDVTVVQNGDLWQRSAVPDDLRNMEDTVNYFAPRGFDRFAVFGKNMLRASTTIAVRTDDALFTVGHAVICASPTESVDALVQRMGRSSTDTGLALPDDFCIQIVTDEDSFNSVKTYTRFEGATHEQWSADKTAVEIMRDSYDAGLSGKTVGNLRHSLEAFAPPRPAKRAKTADAPNPRSNLGKFQSSVSVPEDAKKAVVEFITTLRQKRLELEAEGAVFTRSVRDVFKDGMAASYASKVALYIRTVFELRPGLSFAALLTEPAENLMDAAWDKHTKKDHTVAVQRIRDWVARRPNAT
jgi:hypothetical protein